MILHINLKWYSRGILALVAAGLGLFVSSAAVGQHLAPTKHNLSVSGPGPVRAQTESRICIFCHTPHRASDQPPLWNRADPRTTYLVYDSPTLKSLPGQPTGASRLCLSCHDGTIALGALVSEPTDILFQGGTIYLPAGHSLLGSDLSDDHPVSITYDNNLVAQNPELQVPSLLPATAPLDANSQLQCTSCHDAHMDDYGKFLRTTQLFSQLCISCHLKSGWSGSIHDTSPATWNGAGLDPWPNAPGTTVGQNGCQNCHQPHEAGGQVYLLGYGQEENNCLVCHNGNVGTDIQQDINRPYNHPVASSSGIHVPGENPLSMARHVECTDCHNPHAASAVTSPTGLDGSLRMVDGIDLNGSSVTEVSHAYEICFKCHGDNHGTTPVVTRIIDNLNTRQEFDPGAVSFHPVASQGRSSSVPSLIPPLTPASLIECTDCHASSSGVPGPHGSSFNPLLKAKYNTMDNLSESASQYALCYSCHERSVILSKMGGFKEHNKHIVKEKVSCSACHDPHGISAGSGNSQNNSHLINFDLSIVSPDPRSGLLEFRDLGNRRGECYLTCHGEKHDPERY